MKKGIVITTLIFIAAMSVFFVQSLKLETISDQGIPGPGYTPKIYLAIGLLAALFVLFNAFRLDQRTTKPIVFNGLVWKTMLLSVAYIIVIPYLGYLLATCLGFVAIYKVLGMPGWVKPITIPVGFSIFIYVVFVKLLLVPIPNGKLIQLLGVN